MSMMLAAVVTGAALAGFPFEKPFTLHDAHGKAMGRALAVSQGNLVVQLTVDGKRYLAETQPVVLARDQYSTTLVDFESSALSYPTLDCSGTAYSMAVLNLGAPSAAISISSKGQVWLYPAGDTARSMTMNSFRLTPDGDCQQGGGGSIYVPLGEPVDITSLYKRPFHLNRD